MIDGRRETLLSSDRDKLPFLPVLFDYPLDPERGFGKIAEHFFDGSNLFLVLPPTELTLGANQQSMVTLKRSRCDLALVWFERELPASIPLRFETPAGKARAQALDGQVLASLRSHHSRSRSRRSRSSA